MTIEGQKTALYDRHVALNARMVSFAGWQMPIQYQGVIAEHLACRQAAAIFDVSHMGEISVQGSDARDFVEALIPNKLPEPTQGKAVYSQLCRQNGTIVDDLIVYPLKNDFYLLVVNASNTVKAFEWIQQVQNDSKWNRKQIHLKNCSNEYSQIAVQGPKALEIYKAATGESLESIPNYGFTFLGNYLVSRTGYTGESGFEIYTPWLDGPRIWDKFLETGQRFGLKPAGLAARDTLRLEMKYPLYGQELTDETTPLDAGLDWSVKLDKGDFLGRDFLVQQKENGVTKKLVGISLLESGVPRPHYPVFLTETAEAIGELCSGTHSPSLQKAIATAYVPKEFSKIGTKLLVGIRDKKILAEVVATPFYKRSL